MVPVALTPNASWADGVFCEQTRALVEAAGAHAHRGRRAHT